VAQNSCHNADVGLQPALERIIVWVPCATRKGELTTETLPLKQTVRHWCAVAGQGQGAGVCPERRKRFCITSDGWKKAARRRPSRELHGVQLMAGQCSWTVIEAGGVDAQWIKDRCLEIMREVRRGCTADHVPPGS
jgi:hypothetical protein